MIEDGNRLSFSILGKDITITNATDNTMYVRTVNKPASASSLDKKIVFDHIQTIQQLLLNKKLHWLGYKPFTSYVGEETTRIVETTRFCYRFVVNGKCAELSEYELKGERGFDSNKLLRDINFAYSVVAMDSKQLQPKRDIVRHVVDVGLIVWNYMGHVIACRDFNVKNFVMTHCLFDDVYYDELHVKVLRDKFICQIYDKENNLVVEVPADNSVLTYFENDKEELKDGESSSSMV